MSDYCREKVLRIPAEKIIPELNYGCSYDEFEDALKKRNVELSRKSGFSIAVTERLFLDYFLESDYGCESGDWGKVRKLYDSEKERLAPLFKKINRDVNMNDVHLVEYCWYNCCEAPDYYELEEDPFYKEIFLEKENKDA